MRDLKELIKEHQELFAQYKTFPREWFRKPGETKPPFSFYRSPELKAHDEKLKAKTEEIRDHPDYRELEPDLRRVLGIRIAQDKDFAQKVYAALCNVDWVHEKGSVDTYSWRAAGGQIAEIRNESEDYLTFYCSGNEGHVDPEIEEALAHAGWRPLTLG